MKLKVAKPGLTAQDRISVGLFVSVLGLPVTAGKEDEAARREIERGRGRLAQQIGAALHCTPE